MKDKIEVKDIEKSFCTHWSGWDDHGIMQIYLYDVTPVPGMCPEGTKDIYVDGENGVVAFYDESGEEISSVRVKLAIDSD